MINNIKNLLNRTTLSLLFTYFVLGVGFTYAYLAFQIENTSTIVGNVMAIDATLDVELVVGTNTKMIPLSSDALSNAINGVGGTSACVDANGNLSCQVYKITLTNNGSRLQNLLGTIKLYAEDGTNNVYNNLKWRELSNITTVKSDSIVNGMPRTTLISNLTMETNEVKERYIAVWVEEIDSDQTNTDKGEFGGVINIEINEQIGDAFIEKKLKSKAQKDKDIDFSKTSEESGPTGIYVRNGTENNTNPVYYYRGDVEDNNLIFANFCWKAVRTTDTGGLKLIYNGVASNANQCNNSSKKVIENGAFNAWDWPYFVGYMYSIYNFYAKDMNNITDAYYYGNDVIYSNGIYTLVNTITNSDWSTIYNGGLNNNHYTCFTTGTTCEEVYYIYYTDSVRARYIKLTEGEKINNALNDIFGADDGNNEIYNKISSGIKNRIDSWYLTNIEQQGYSNYIEDTVWCNDRTISNKAGWEPNGGNTRNYLKFSAVSRMDETHNPSISCNRKIDSFTAEDEMNGNGNLTYPIGLLTVDEAMLAGATGNWKVNQSYYLYGGSFWSMSPIHYDENWAQLYLIGSDRLSSAYAGQSNGIRPSISLKSGFIIGAGNGTVDNPYIVE